MKVTFLIPPVLDGTQNVDRTSGCNYGIYFLPLLPFLYCPTLLKDEVDRISIVDFAATKKTVGDFKNFIRSDDSDIYIMYTVYLCQETDKIARRMIREAGSEARFIFSGPQATSFPEAFLDSNDTFVARGEPEYVVRDIVRALRRESLDMNAIFGLSYCRNGEVIHNPVREFIANLDELPIPDRTLMDHSCYYNPKLRKTPHTAMLTSRGCFARCWYCVPHSLVYCRELEHKKLHGKKPPPRLHSVERVIEEFKEIKRLGFRSVSVMDDEFLWNEKRAIEICNGIKDLGLEWFCLARPDMITGRVAAAMAEAGCLYIDMGTESFDQGVLDAIGKGMTVEDTKNAVRILKAHGIEPELNILFGATPVETEETIKTTLKTVKELDVDYVLFSIASPFPGTDFYEAAKKNGWLVYGEYRATDPAKESIISYPHLSKERLEWFASYAYMSHYFHPKYLIRQIFRVRSLRDFKNKLSTGLNLIRRNYLRR
ncbi:MAG: radical SAM protein [Candidatus Omnitrophota bacterium]